jgi:hypothetical protein
MPMLDQLHSGELSAPDFQRSFVWGSDATRELIVSMIRGFPVGNLLFLQGGGQGGGKPSRGPTSAMRRPVSPMLSAGAASFAQVRRNS